MKELSPKENEGQVIYLANYFNDLKNSRVESICQENEIEFPDSALEVAADEYIDSILLPSLKREP